MHVSAHASSQSWFNLLTDKDPHLASHCAQRSKQELSTLSCSRRCIGGRHLTTRPLRSHYEHRTSSSQGFQRDAREETIARVRVRQPSESPAGVIFEGITRSLKGLPPASLIPSAVAGLSLADAEDVVPSYRIVVKPVKGETKMDARHVHA